MSSADVRGLTLVAVETGYLSARNDDEIKQGFPYVQTLTCKDVVAGHKSWDDVRREDIDNGAPSAAAGTMVRYLKDTYCLSVRD